MDEMGSGATSARSRYISRRREVMRVSCKKTGGVAGLKIGAEVDSDDLSPAERREMKELVERAKLFDQPAKPGGKPMPDQFQYEITIEDQGKKHSFVTNDATASEELLDLIDWLFDAARKQKTAPRR
jgi:Emfourin